MKRIFLLVMAVATTIGARASVRENLYLGAGVGASFNNYDIFAMNPGDGFAVRRKRTRTTALGNVFLGFGHTFCPSFYLAAEVGTNFPKRSFSLQRPGATFTAMSFRNRFSVQDYITGDLLPGFRLNECWLLYARVGASYSHFHFHQDPVLGVPAFHADRNRWGGRFGAGINWGFCKRFGLGIDYYYSLYPNVNKLLVLNEFSTSVKNRVHSNYIGISLFCSL